MMNYDCQCECKELDDYGSCKSDYIWHVSMYDCKYNNQCKVDKYLDIKICSCEKLYLSNM